MNDLNLVFQSLPTPVKDWLVSDLSQNVLNDIGRKYNFSLTQEIILSQLFLRLVTQDLPPQSFTGALKSELELKEEEAAETTRMIDEKIIEPISSELLATGLDRKLLYYSAPGATTLPASLNFEENKVVAPGKSPTKPASFDAAPAKGEAHQGRQDKPFILHEEKEVKPSAAESPASSPSFIFKAPATVPIAPSQPTKVTIERVVHYSNFFTPLNCAPLRYYQKVKVPRSKWFKDFV